MLPLRHRCLIAALLVLALLVSCARQPSSPDTLTVFAAASLAEAFTEMGDRFEAEHPGMSVTFNFAGSQQLAQQLVQGAPADVFASADQNQMKAAIQAGRLAAGSPQVFAQNRLIVIVSLEAGGQVQRLQDLAAPGLRLVLADGAVPAGRYSLEFLDKAAWENAYGAGFKEEVLENVVSYEENVRAVLSKVILGEADAGIVYFTDLSAANAGQLQPLSIPDELNVLASYEIAALDDSPQPALAGQFIDFALSSTGQDILTDYGFFPVR